MEHHLTDFHNEIEDDDVFIDVRIASFCWESGRIASTFFNLNTMEMFITQEMIDLRPDYSYFNNLYRQMKPTIVLANGPTHFVKEAMRLSNLSDEEDPNIYRVNMKTKRATFNFVVYKNSESDSLANHQRILKLKLPGMNTNYSPEERQSFIESIIPLTQDLVAKSLGNMLDYLDSNCRHIFYGNDPVITDLKVFASENQVLIDEITYFALQIYSPGEHHPSAFKRLKNKKTLSDKGVSVYSLFNQCVSRMGSLELKMMFQQPIRNIDILNMRYDTIEWFIDPKNQRFVELMRSHLKHLVNVGATFSRIVLKKGKPSLWANFKRTLVHMCSISDICARLVASGMRVKFFASLGCCPSQINALRRTLYIIDQSIDIKTGIKQGQFIAKEGIDPLLDDKRMQILSIKDLLHDTGKKQVEQMPEYIDYINVYYFIEFGFLLGLNLTDIPNESMESLKALDMHFMFKLNGKHYFSTPDCNTLNEQYGPLYVEICEMEQKISDKTIGYVTSELPYLQQMANLCAQLDCLIAMALTARENGYLRPKITSKKALTIKHGRHLLIEKCCDNFVPNSISLSAESRNLIQILSAPNSTGKSIYLKQISLTAYLVHIGSFVPAAYVEMPLLDSIYSRINCDESLYTCNSSFMGDLQQMAYVMKSSSQNSLIVIDEFGKGTNVSEGQAILASCLENLNEKGEASPLAIITTHYANIVDYVQSLEWIRCYTIKTHTTVDGSIKSDYQVISGIGPKNYAMSTDLTKEFVEFIIKSNSEENPNDKSSVSYMQKEIVNSRIKFICDIIFEYKKENFISFEKAREMFHSYKL